MKNRNIEEILLKILLILFVFGGGLLIFFVITFSSNDDFVEGLLAGLMYMVAITFFVALLLEEPNPIKMWKSLLNFKKLDKCDLGNYRVIAVKETWPVGGPKTFYYVQFRDPVYEWIDVFESNSIIAPLDFYPHGFRTKEGANRRLEAYIAKKKKERDI